MTPRRKQTPAPIPPEEKPVVEPVVLPEPPVEVTRLQQARTEQVNAVTVQMEDSLAGQVTAEEVSVSESLIGLVQTRDLEAQNSLLAVSSATSAVVHGVVGVSIGQETTLADTRAGVIVTNQLTSNHIQSVVVIANHINGPVEVFADRRSIALFGILAGLALGIVFSVFRLLRGR